MQINEFLTLINELDNDPKSSFDLKDLSLFSDHQRGRVNSAKRTTYPLSIVEHEGFRKFVTSLQPLEIRKAIYTREFPHMALKAT